MSQLGVHVEVSELSSGFVEFDRGGADNYPPVPRNLVDQPRILKWLRGIPEVMNPNKAPKRWIDSLTYAHGMPRRPVDVPELDDWDVRTVALKDSTRLIADGSRLSIVREKGQASI